MRPSRVALVLGSALLVAGLAGCSTYENPVSDDFVSPPPVPTATGSYSFTQTAAPAAGSASSEGTGGAWTFNPTCPTAAAVSALFDMTFTANAPNNTHTGVCSYTGPGVVVGSADISIATDQSWKYISAFSGHAAPQVVQHPLLGNGVQITSSSAACLTIVPATNEYSVDAGGSHNPEPNASIALTSTGTAITAAMCDQLIPFLRLLAVQQ